MNMERKADERDFEVLSLELNDDDARGAYKTLYDDYKPGFVPRIFGGFLIWCGNVFYGTKPSYLKFRSIEVIARVPYHSWTTSVYTLLTMFYMNEDKAIDLSCTNEFAQIAQDNETMHVVVISQLAKRANRRANFMQHTLVPMIFAFFYFWVAYFMHLISKRSSYELNYLFEKHAFEQYDEFIRENEAGLKEKKCNCDFLTWYGRSAENEYEFFCQVRNDELIHRNASIEEIELDEENAQHVHFD